MDSPLHLLRLSTRENEQELRRKKIIRACKIITDTFPFEEQRELLAEESELVKYLILNWIFVKSSIEIIIETLFQIFQKKKHFLMNVWNNFVEISCISEENEATQKFINLGETEPQLENPKQFLHFLQNDYSVISNTDFNLDIQQNLIEIKLKTLQYSLKILEFMSQISMLLPKALINANMDLYKLFMINSLNDLVLLRTCECIEFCKKKFIFFFQNICIFDGQIEEILMNKKTEILKRNLSKKSKLSMMSFPRPLLESPAMSPMIPMDFSLDQIKTASIVETHSNDNPPKFMLVNKVDQDSEEEIPQKEDEEDDPLEREKKIKKQFIQELDKWLCFDETNLISLNENMSLALKMTENLEIFLNFIVNPFKYPIEPYWAERYECISQRKFCFDFRCYKLMNPVEEKEWSSNSLQKTFYYLRSYKASTILCSRRNLKYLITVNEKSFSSIFLILQNALKLHEFNKFNLFHIGKILNTFMILEPKFTLNSFLRMEFLSLLSCYLYNPLIFDIFLNLVSPNSSKFALEESLQAEIWKHCYNNKLFIELSLQMLRGSEFPKAESKINIVEYNFPTKYEKTTKNSLHSEELLKIDLDKVLGKNSSLDSSSDFQFHNQREYLWMEEISGQKTDIDNFRSFIKQRRTVSTNKSIILTQNDTSSRKLSRKISRSNSGTSRKKDYPDFDEFQEFDLKKDNLNSKKAKNLTKGQRLFQKLRFVLKMKDKSQLFQRILQANEALPNEKSGYSTGSLIKVYPDIRLLVNYGEIEKLSRLRGFASESIVDAERVSMPISEFFYNLLKESLDFEENNKWLDVLQLEKKDQTFLVEMICDHECSIVQKMFMNYLVKVKPLGKLQEFSNSAFEAGKFINLTLSRLKKHTVLKKNYDKIHKLCLENFAFLSKLIIDMESIKKNPITLPGLTLDNPLGTTKLLLIETFSLIIANDEANQYAILEEINETVWHILFLWFFGNRTNDNFHHKFYECLRTAIWFGSEKSIIKMLFKVNLLASLYNSYEGILKNGVAMNVTHIESYLLYLKKIVYDIHHLLQDKTDFKIVRRQIEGCQSWKMLHLLLIEKFRFGILEKLAKKPTETTLPPISKTNKRNSSSLDSTTKLQEQKPKQLFNTSSTTNLTKKPLLAPKNPKNPLLKKIIIDIAPPLKLKQQETTPVLLKTRQKTTQSLHVKTTVFPIKALKL